MVCQQPSTRSPRHAMHVPDMRLEGSCLCAECGTCCRPALPSGHLWAHVLHANAAPPSRQNGTHATTSGPVGSVACSVLDGNRECSLITMMPLHADRSILSVHAPAPGHSAGATARRRETCGTPWPVAQLSHEPAAAYCSALSENMVCYLALSTGRSGSPWGSRWAPAWRPCRWRSAWQPRRCH